MKVKAYGYIIVVISFKDGGKMMNLMEREDLFGKMEVIMKVSIKMVITMVLD